MSLQKMIADVETERTHNKTLGLSVADRFHEIKARHAEEIDALAEELRIEFAARDAALARIVTGDTNAG